MDMELIVAGLVLMAVGLFSAISPNMMWTMRVSWKYKDNPEPSDLYRFLIRAGGVVLCLVGVGLIIHTIVQGRLNAEAAAEAEEFFRRADSELGLTSSESTG